MTSHTNPLFIYLFIVLSALLLSFLGKTRPTLPLIGYVALLDASLTCLAVLVKGQEKRQRTLLSM